MKCWTEHEAVFGEVCFDVQLTAGVKFTATDALLGGKTKGRLTRAKHNISPPQYSLSNGSSVTPPTPITAKGLSTPYLATPADS